MSKWGCSTLPITKKKIYVDIEEDKRTKIKGNYKKFMSHTALINSKIGFTSVT